MSKLCTFSGILLIIFVHSIKTENECLNRCLSKGIQCGESLRCQTDGLYKCDRVFATPQYLQSCKDGCQKKILEDSYCIGESKIVKPGEKPKPQKPKKGHKHSGDKSERSHSSDETYQDYGYGYGHYGHHGDHSDSANDLRKKADLNKNIMTDWGEGYDEEIKEDYNKTSGNSNPLTPSKCGALCLSKGLFCGNHFNCKPNNALYRCSGFGSVPVLDGLCEKDYACFHDVSGNNDECKPRPESGQEMDCGRNCSKKEGDYCGTRLLCPIPNAIYECKEEGAKPLFKNECQVRFCRTFILRNDKCGFWF